MITIDECIKTLLNSGFHECETYVRDLFHFEKEKWAVTLVRREIEGEWHMRIYHGSSIDYTDWRLEDLEIRNGKIMSPPYSKYRDCVETDCQRLNCMRCGGYRFG